MNNRKQRKKWIIFACLVSVCLLLLTNVAVRNHPFDGGGCISVTFDKLPMMLANRAVIRVGENRYEVTDRELVRQITSETMCASNTDLCYQQTDRWIDVYCGDVLIRSMMWEAGHNAIIVYHASIFHWVFPSDEGLGMVDPSDDMLQKLENAMDPKNDNHT